MIWQINTFVNNPLHIENFANVYYVLTQIRKNQFMFFINKLKHHYFRITFVKTCQIFFFFFSLEGGGGIFHKCYWWYLICWYDVLIANLLRDVIRGSGLIKDFRWFFTNTLQSFKYRLNVMQDTLTSCMCSIKKEYGYFGIGRWKQYVSKIFTIISFEMCKLSWKILN